MTQTENVVYAVALKFYMINEREEKRRTLSISLLHSQIFLNLEIYQLSLKIEIMFHGMFKFREEVSRLAFFIML